MPALQPALAEVEAELAACRADVSRLEYAVPVSEEAAVRQAESLRRARRELARIERLYRELTA